MKWPPLIDSSHLPWWVVMRDMLATLCAWALLLYFLRDMAWMVAYWLLGALGIALAAPWEAGKMWRDTRPFLQVVALLTAWLFVFAIVRWKLLTDRSRAARQPDALDLQQLAGAFGVPIEVVSRLQAASSCTVHGVDPLSGRGGADTVVTEGAIAPGAGIDPPQAAAFDRPSPADGEPEA